MAGHHLAFSTEEVLHLFEPNELASKQQDTLEETFTSYVGVDISEPEADSNRANTVTRMVLTYMYIRTIYISMVIC